MSSAEQERIEKAWEEAEIPIDCVLGDNKWAVMKNGFRYGFLAGRADAMEMPEVRAEDLVRGEAYLMRSVGAREWSFYRCEKVGAFIGAKVCFRGPLRVGEGK